MKILICSVGYNSYKNNDIGIFQLDQAKALKSKGHDVRIATLDLRSIRRRRPLTSKYFETFGIKAYTVNAFCGRVPGWVINPIGKLCAKKAFRDICDDGWKPDIIHAHFTEMSYFFCDIANKNNIPFIVTEHSSAILNSNKNSCYQAAKSYYKADSVLAVSTALASVIRKNFNINVKVIPNVIDLKKFDFFKKEKSQNCFKYISAANLTHGKGMDVLINAFSKLKYSNIELNILGDGPERVKLQQLAQDLGISNKVKFWGRYTREEFNEYLQNSDCFVLASRFETFGVVYAEAMATGTPVIATRCGGPEDFVNNEVGLLVDVDNVDALSEAMDYMYHNSAGFNAQKIRDYVVSKFSPSQIAKQCEEVYSEILKERKGL